MFIMNRHHTSIRRVSNKLLWQLKIKGNNWEWYPFYYRAANSFYCFKLKGNKIMKNRSFVIGLAFAGLAMQVFPLICSGALKQGYIDGFSAASVITLFTAFILAIWSQPCPKDKDREREDIYRDFDAVYRHIDDTARDLREDIRECESNKCCKVPCGKK
jgi:hypothetical protein